MSEFLQSFPALLGIAVLFAGAAIYIRSGIVKQNREETAELAETRGHRIDDLETEVANLKEELDEVKAHIRALESLKVEEFGVEVERRLAPYFK